MPAARILLANELRIRLPLRRCRGGEQPAAALGSPVAVTPVVRAYAAMARAFYIESPSGAARMHSRPDEAIVELERYRAEDELALLPYARVYRGYLLNDLHGPDEALSEAARTGGGVQSSRHRAVCQTSARLHPTHGPRRPWPLG